MAKLKVPSAQHLARNWQETPVMVQKGLVDLVKHPPTFSYQALYGFVRDMLVFGVSEADIERAIRKKVRRPDVQANFLELLPLIAGYFSDLKPTYVSAIDRQFYSAGRGLMVPFDPPLIYRDATGIVFPWFSFWKSNPLAGERLSLFVTMVREVLSEDPDLETADFRILDFAVPKRSRARDLVVISSSDVPLLTERRKTEMLEIFAEGYFAALDQLRSEPAAGGDDNAPAPDPDQPGLFD